MSWISLDCRLPDHPKMAALPSDAARYGWIVVLLRSKEQRRQGTFASVSHFKEVLGRHAKYLADYKRAGLLEDDKDGAVAVHGWKQYQWAMDKAKTRERHLQDKAETNLGQEKDSRAGNAVPVLVDVNVLEREGGVGEEGEPEFPLLQWLAQHGCYVTPGNGYHRQLVTAVEHSGLEPMLAMLDKLSRAGVQDGDTKGFVFGAIDALKPKPDLRALRDEEDEAQREVRRKRREEYNQRQLAYLRGEAPAPGGEA